MQNKVFSFVVEGFQKPAFNPAKQWTAVVRTHYFSGSFDFETLEAAKAYLAHQCARGVVSCDDLTHHDFPQFGATFIINRETFEVSSLADLGIAFERSNPWVKSRNVCMTAAEHAARVERVAAYLATRALRVSAVQIVDGRPVKAWTPGTIDDARRAFLLSGMGARTTHGNVTLQVFGQAFRMSAPGADSVDLYVDATDAARLDAHWQAYCAAHAEPAPALDKAGLALKRARVKARLYELETADIAAPESPAFATGDEIERAREFFGGDNIAIDEGAAVSRGNDGTWVAAWVFLPAAKESDL